MSAPGLTSVAVTRSVSAWERSRCRREWGYVVARAVWTGLAASVLAIEAAQSPPPTRTTPVVRGFGPRATAAERRAGSSLDSAMSQADRGSDGFKRVGESAICLVACNPDVVASERFSAEAPIGAVAQVIEAPSAIAPLPAMGDILGAVNLLPG